MTIESDRGQGTNPESYLRRMLGDQFSATVGSVLTEFLSLPRTSEVIPEQVLAKVAAGHAAGDELAAILALAESIPSGPVTSSPERSMARLRPLIAAGFSEREDKVIIKNPSPVIFPLGRAAHRMREELELASGDALQLSKETVSPVIERDLVRKFRVSPKDKQELKQGSFFGTFSSPVDQDQEIFLIEPLSPPKPGQTSADWALGIINQSFAQLNLGDGIPNRPREIAEIIENGESRVALLQALEAAQVIFGDRPGMNLFTQEQGKKEAGYPPKINEFAVLNWLSLLKSVLQAREEGQNKSTAKEVGVLAEIPIGNLKVSINDQEPSPLTVKTGVVDLLKVSWVTPPRERGIIYNSSSNLALVTGRIQGLFHQQDKRYHRRGVVNGENKIVRTELGRTARSFFLELWRQYGDNIFTDLNINLIDLKFPGGDSGWTKTFDPANLPDEEHIRQVSEYLFFVAAQLCWVRKWSQGEGENFTLTLKEVVQFAGDYNLFPRLKAEVRYQTPAGEMPYCISLTKKADSLEELGRQVLEKRLAAMAQDQSLRLSRALFLICAHRLEGAEIRRREGVALPETIKDICCDYYLGRYLQIESLAEKIFGGTEGGEKLTVEKAVYFKESGIFVFWAGLSGKGELLRFAVSNKGQFTIQGFEEGMIKGELANLKMLGVKRKPEDLVRSFKQEIWDRFKQTGVLIAEYDSPVGSDFVVCPDGLTRLRVKDKPVVCDYNPLEGRWRLDLTRLKEAVASFSGKEDKFRLSQLAGLINKRNPGTVFCPLPFHDNRETEAAYLYIDGEELYITCFADHVKVFISRKSRIGRFEGVPLTSGRRIDDYRPVSPGRKKAFETSFAISGIIAGNDQTARKYLAARGIDPDRDLGQYGYIPPEFSKTVATLVDLPLFKEICHLRGRNDLRLDEISSFVEAKQISDGEPLLGNVRKVLDFLRSLDQANQARILQKMTLRELREMQTRGIIGLSKDGLQRWGGRVLLPTYWVESHGGGHRLAMANLYGRGITTEEGQRLYEDRPHIKAHLRQGAKVIEGKRVRATPTGIWVRDPDAFLLNAKDLVIVFEACFDAASFGRFRPELRDNSLAVVGTGYQELIALLKWWGTKEVCLAYDFDKGGTAAYYRAMEHILGELPEISISGIHEYLPGDVKKLAPPYLPVVYDEGGPYYKRSLDMNDILRIPEVFQKYGHRG